MGVDAPPSIMRMPRSSERGGFTSRDSVYIKASAPGANRTVTIVPDSGQDRISLGTGLSESSARSLPDFC